MGHHPPYRLRVRSTESQAGLHGDNGKAAAQRGREGVRPKPEELARPEVPVRRVSPCSASKRPRHSRTPPSNRVNPELKSSAHAMSEVRLRGGETGNDTTRPLVAQCSQQGRRVTWTTTVASTTRQASQNPRVRSDRSRSHPPCMQAARWHAMRRVSMAGENAGTFSSGARGDTTMIPSD